MKLSNPFKRAPGAPAFDVARSDAMRAWLKLPRRVRRAAWLETRRRQCSARKAGTTRLEAKRMFPWDPLFRTMLSRSRPRPTARARLASWLVSAAARVARWIA